MRPLVDWCETATEQKGTAMRETPPAVGTVLDTVYGQQRVMDVMRYPHNRPTVYLRAEGGGTEWTIALADLASVLRADRR